MAPHRSRSFGPRALKTVREKLVRHGLARKQVNKQIGRIKRMFKWATADELIAPSIYHALQAVDGLRMGRTEARETRPILPVAWKDVEATLPHVLPPGPSHDPLRVAHRGSAGRDLPAPHRRPGHHGGRPGPTGPGGTRPLQLKAPRQPTN